MTGCDRGGWSRLLCAAHYTRWRHHGCPDIDEFCATTGPIVARAGSQRVDAFDLALAMLRLGGLCPPLPGRN